jgi:uncharacterized protein
MSTLNQAIASPMTGPERSVPAPTSAPERSEWLDALRGFALLGILLYNIQVFGGFAFRGLMPTHQFLGAGLDPGLEFLANVLIQGKFYSLFAFLFGLGCALQLDRAAQRGAPGDVWLRRRLAWLLVFGLLHATLVWFGDILATYAVLGFALLWFRNVSTRALLAWALAFLSLPVVAYALALGLQLGSPPASSPEMQVQAGIATRIVDTIVGGSYPDLVQLQVQLYPAGWIRRAVYLSLPRIFGMLLLGMWAARVGLPHLGRAQELLLQSWRGYAVAVGLPLSLALAILGGNGALLPLRPEGLLVAALSAFTMPLLCLGYVAVFALHWRGARPGSLLVSAGRTAFSHYIGQSLICVGLFYGIGLGWFGQFGYGIALIIAAAVYLVLAVLARAWLLRFRQGPLEALWRGLSSAGVPATARPGSLP